MTQFFEHTPQGTNVVNQVENLAQEVGDAFNILEDVLHQDNRENASINSSIGSLDNKYIKEYVPDRGWINNYQQTLYFPTNSQSASLDLYPSLLVEDLNTVSISNLANPSKTYIYKNDGVLSNPTDFTFVERKVIFGKAPEPSENLVITYKGFNTTTPEDTSDWPFELKYNILQVKQQNNSIIREFTPTRSSNVYTVSGYNFKSMCSTFIKNIIDNTSQDLSKYVAIYSDEERLDVYDISITTSFVRFSYDGVISGKVKIYVANSSLGKLVECLYRLFYAHDHGTNGGQGVNHSSVLGLYENTDLIQYQSTNKTNYDHPQYFNREGYIQDSTVYNNAILGDLLLASTSNSSRRNNLEANSVKIVFGEYNSGPRFYYNVSDDCLWLDSISRDGIKLVTPKEKRSLSINDHSFIDTQHLSFSSDNALKLALKTNDDKHLGIFKLTRKVVTETGATDDDRAKLLSYASEFSLSLIKEKLTIDNGSKISFGDPGIIDLYLDETGLHFKSDGEGTLSEITKVNFDVPVNAKNITVEHLDAKAMHLTESQKIVFGDSQHSTTYNQGINYENNKLNIKTTDSVVFNNNGRQRGISLDGRQFIYASTAQGFTIQDAVEYTDLFFETKRDTYFIQSGYTYNAGITNLQTVPRSSIYCDSTYVNNVRIEFKETEVNGVVLNSNNKVFAHRDLNDNISTFIQSPGGLAVVSNYNSVGPTLTYGKVTAKTYYAQGDQTTDAGFYGNVIIPVNHKITINGMTEFNSDITFSKPVTFTDKMEANTVQALEVRTNNLYVSDKATYNNVDVLEELRFNSMLQTNRVANSSFEGTVQFNNNVTMPDSNISIIIGNKDIEDRRNTAGLLLNSNEVRLGTNGLVSAGKVIAGKGRPSGDGDRTGGFSFASSTGNPDGDTGMFAEGSIEQQNESDIVFRIDGVEKGRILRETVDINSLDLTGKEKALVTLDMFLNQMSDISGVVLGQVYPIGTVYQNSMDGRNPSVILNWSDSVWRRYSVGRSIMGASGASASEGPDMALPSGLNLGTAGAKYGSYLHTLTIDEMPNHDHQMRGYGGTSGGGGAAAGKVAGNIGPTTATGGSQAHNNTHPIIVTHIWERIG